MGDRSFWLNDNCGIAWTPPMSDADRWASVETAEIEAELRRLNAEQMQSKPLATMGDKNDD